MLCRDWWYILLGYVSGSILFARLFGFLFRRKDITLESKDHNPGTANAFQYGGFWCGLLTLCGDLCKGFFPVYGYLNGRGFDARDIALAFVLVAPVLGHVFPIYAPRKGGKGIAVTFGCLLGLLPEAQPVCTLACMFILLSLVVKVSPHYYRTLAAYVLSAIILPFAVHNTAIVIGFLMICVLVTAKLLLSTEEKEPFQVRAVWKH